MDILSRLQLIKRAVQIACKPPTSGVVIHTFVEGKRLDLHTIGNPTEAPKLYQQFMVSFFTDKSRDAKQLTAVYKTLTILIQNEWNKKHPQDQVLLIAKSSKSIQ